MRKRVEVGVAERGLVEVLFRDIPGRDRAKFLLAEPLQQPQIAEVPDAIELQV